MGSRGPKPLPANVHRLRNNPSKLTEAELAQDLNPEVEIPSCPKHLWPEARKEWRRVSRELINYGLISKLDRAALALYCQEWARLVWAEEQLARAMRIAAEGEAAAIAAGKDWTGGDGFMLPTPNGGSMYSPYWVAANKASERVDRFLASFGMSPSSRGRVSPSSRQADMFGDKGPEGWNAV